MEKITINELINHINSHDMNKANGSYVFYRDDNSLVVSRDEEKKLFACICNYSSDELNKFFDVLVKLIESKGWKYHIAINNTGLGLEKADIIFIFSKSVVLQFNDTKFALEYSNNY